MIKDKFNVNIIMCESVDKKVTNIKNICDTVKLDENDELSFGIVVNINTINCNEKEFYFLYTVEKINDSKQNNLVSILDLVHIKSTLSEKNEKNTEKHLKSSIPNCGQSMLGYNFKKQFPGRGAYELQVYKYDTMDGLLDDKNKFDYNKLNKDNLMCTYGFEVI